MPEHQQVPRSNTATNTATAATTDSTTVEGQDLVGNDAIQEAIASGDSAAVAQIDPIYTGIVFIGMGDHAHDEARNLNAWNRGSGGAKSVRQRGREQDVVTRAGQVMDLKTEEGQNAFIATLSLSPEQADRALTILQGTGSRAKDEMAQILEVYIQAEEGLRDMQRLVLSGHSVGSQIWGDHNGSLDFDLFIDLAELFPTAANQVKHLMVSACYSGGERTMQQYFDMFPSLESIVAYDGSSPGTWSGALVHMKEWEKRTEDSDGTDVERSMAEGTRKGDKMATWNTEDGYQGQSPMSIWDLENDLSNEESTFQRFYTGEEEVANSQSGPLREYYNLVQRVLGHPETSSSRAAELSVRRDTTIRLLYWKVITPKFEAGYKTELEAGYTSAGRTKPNFGKLTRGDFMAEYAAVEELAAASSEAAVAELQRLVEGLAQMSEEVIPTTWV